jgi:hypothetical protein
MTALAVEAPVVEPAHVWRPPNAVRNMAGPLSRLSASLGRPLFAEQVTGLEVLTGQRADGTAATLLACVICGRQSMKTWDMQLIALGRMLAPAGDRYAVWSAHEVATSQETFRDFLSLVEQFSWLARRVVKTSESNGKEAIIFRAPDGRSRVLRFRARRRTGGRGLTGDSLFLDEAFALEPRHMGSLLPILSTRRRAAVFLGSSAGMPESEVLRGIRDRGRAGGRGAPAYVEFCAPGSFAEPGCDAPKCLHAVGTDGCVLDDERLWPLGNPAVRVGRITLEHLRNERGEMTPTEWARERYGWWEDPPGASVGGLSWTSLYDRESTPLPRPSVLVFDVELDQSSATVMAVGKRADGLAHVELLACRPGVDWLRDFLLDKQRSTGSAAWHLGGKRHPVASVLPRLTGVRLHPVPATDFAAACTHGAKVIKDKGVRHRGDPLVSTALSAATPARAGDGGWVISRQLSDGDIAPAVCVFLGLWGLANPVSDPLDNIW